VEARDVDQTELKQEFLREATMLRYIPMAISQFDAQESSLMYQNPEACRMFGSSSSSEDHDQDQDETVGETESLSSKKEPSTSLTESSAPDEEPSSRQQPKQPQQPQNSSSAVSPAESLENGKIGLKEQKNSERLEATMKTLKEEENKEEDDTPACTEDDLPCPNKKNHFLNCFVNKKVGWKVFYEINASKEVNVKALVKTTTGPSWNAIHARLGKDAVSKDPIILYSAWDISDIVNAKKETQVNLVRAEFTFDFDECRC
jgi:hypothetical protein